MHQKNKKKVNADIVITRKFLAHTFLPISYWFVPEVEKSDANLSVSAENYWLLSHASSWRSGRTQMPGSQCCIHSTIHSLALSWQPQGSCLIIPLPPCMETDLFIFALLKDIYGVRKLCNYFLFIIQVSFLHLEDTCCETSCLHCPLKFNSLQTRKWDFFKNVAFSESSHEFNFSKSPLWKAPPLLCPLKHTAPAERLPHTHQASEQHCWTGVMMKVLHQWWIW